ncbi:response regulator transcription factor [Isoptericola dokdonensis]|uniref:Transcriptional regulatory protein LiaR n=1 Tax=Isoptericola dokdonensis DS-3 TaxID=1300344 RepID=A0A161HZV4_9MICO|nr:response regulator transcription factor [Isoptericola dokdonensis]ANC32223.1 Transcriptional regulatory protein LiaR [Isoptericola dokdonensis DS-3]
MTSVLLVDDQRLVRSGFRLLLEAEDDLEVVGEAADGAAAVEAARRLRPDVVLMDVQMPVMDGIEATGRVVAEGTARVLVLTTFDDDAYVFDALSAGASGFLLKNADPDHLVDAVRTVASGHALLSPEVTRRVVERMVASGAAPRTADSAPGAGSDGSGRTTGAADRVGPSAGPGRRDDGGAQGPPARAAGQAAADGGPVPTAAPSDRAGGGAPPELDRLTAREHEVLELVGRGLSNAEIAAALFLGEATVKTHVSNVLAKLHLRDRVQAVVYVHRHGLSG